MQNLETLLDELEHVHADHGEVSLAGVVDAVGHRAFGPMLVVPGLLVLSPAGGVPGMATMLGLVSLFVAGQLLIGRRSLWLPHWLLRGHLKRERFRRALRAMRKPARAVDRVLKPRLQWAVRRPGVQLVALAGTLVALVTPFLELVPFADTVPAAALTAFGLALIAHDGLLALVAAALCVCGLGLAGAALL